MAHQSFQQIGREFNLRKHEHQMVATSRNRARGEHPFIGRRRRQASDQNKAGEDQRQTQTADKKAKLTTAWFLAFVTKEQSCEKKVTSK
jgi:hypothetical protein